MVEQTGRQRLHRLHPLLLLLLEFQDVLLPLLLEHRFAYRLAHLDLIDVLALLKQEVLVQPRVLVLLLDILNVHFLFERIQIRLAFD